MRIAMRTRLRGCVSFREEATQDCRPPFGPYRPVERQVSASRIQRGGISLPVDYDRITPQGEPGADLPGSP